MKKLQDWIDLSKYEKFNTFIKKLVTEDINFQKLSQLRKVNTA